MKLPIEAKDQNSDVIAVWQKAASQLSLEHGIYITVKLEWEPYPNRILIGLQWTDVTDYYVKRIYFKVMDHEFESLRQLQKALESKAFL